MITTLILIASFASAQTAGPTAAMLKERYMSSLEDAEKTKALEVLAKTAPASGQDVAALFDLFSRDQNAVVRQAVMDSLALISRGSPQLEPLFVSYLKQPEPEAQLFGVNGAFRLRSREALPLVRDIAKRRFAAAHVNDTAVLTERNAWWAQYEALSVLAQWEGEKALPLIGKKADESPEVARLLGRFFWRQTLPEMRKWTESKDPKIQRKAIAAARASIEPADARATRDAMMALIRDPKVDEELRHQLALKVGVSSDDAEAETLVEEHDKAADTPTRLLWAAAAFASRSRKVVPLLVRYAKQSSDEQWRASSKIQLLDMLGEAQTKTLLEDAKKP
ncbi:MAG: hypothetical protein A2V88_14685 [Elusimicrobia bacterium RBG_16_66_12]|nr:MAG: hypothetical protein A2V88_14685 [Elusimicrobia bacterium RBG_16_66_12]